MALIADSERVVPPEKDVLRAAICLLEQLEGCASSEPRYPDEINRQTPDVDATVTIGAKRFAIEHTSVEQFPDATKEYVFLESQAAVLESAAASLRDRLPAGAYELQILGPIEVKKNKFELLLGDLADEVVVVARDLKASPLAGPNIRAGTVRRGKAKISYRLVRGHDPDVPDPTLAVAVLRRFSRPSEASVRHSIVKRLLAAKCRKLSCYRKQGFTTVLLLEDRSFSPSPYPLLLRAHSELCKGFADTTDLLVKVSCEHDIWSLQYVWIDEAPSRNVFKTNCWVWDPAESRIVKKEWEEGARQAMLSARSKHQGKLD